MYFVTTRTSSHADGSKFRVLDHTDKRGTARSQAAKLEGTVRNQAELDKLIEAGRVDLTTLPGYVVPESAKSWVDIAAEVKAEAKQSNTIGKREKFKKRFLTDLAVLKDAEDTFDALVDDGDALVQTKVGIVRWFAGWKNAAGTKLQRRDVFGLIRGYPSLANIADATISTQFQLVRSGKAKM